MNEIRILASLSCPYMIRFYEAFIEGDQVAHPSPGPTRRRLPLTPSAPPQLHIVTDYAAYGDLHRQMKKHSSRNTTFSERAVWSFFLQLCVGGAVGLNGGFELLDLILDSRHREFHLTKRNRTETVRRHRVAGVRHMRIGSAGGLDIPDGFLQ